MCTYSVKIDDAVMRRARLHFKGSEAMRLWIEQQLHKALVDYVSQVEKRENKVEAALSELTKLENDWDGYGAPAISRKAIGNCRMVTKSCQQTGNANIDIMPTEYGGVQVKWTLPEGGLLSCDFGDETMSYYVERKGKETVYVSFEEYTPENINKLSSYLIQ
ncbi:MAG: hypothetical protein K6A94_06370 [Bacteroidales bacterium]|nr:hypothetical protein [Bacteroidales bacterium]